MNDVVTTEKTTEKPAVNVSREIAVLNQGNAAVPMPANFEQMTKFASMMAAGGAMVGVPFRENPGACLGALMQAMRWGMDPYACSQKMYIASRSGDGPIAYEAQLVHAVLLKNAPIRKRPRFKFEGEGDNRVCIVTFHLIDDDEAIEYQSPPISKVRKPRDKGSPLWYDNPDQQLAYYTIRAAARLHFPDVIMGVYTPDEIDQAPTARVIEAGNTITLSGAAPTDTNNIPDADFSDGTIVLEKNARKKKPAKEKGAPPVAAEATGDSETEGGSSSDAPTNNTPAAEPNEPEPEGETDEQIVLRVAAEVRAAPANGRSQPIRDAKGALTRIAQTSEDKKLAAKAEQMLNLYDLD